MEVEIMYELYFHKSPNTYKVAIFLEEAGLEYKTHVVNVGKGEQFSPEFVAISPNSKVPVLVDHCPVDGGEPIVMFESGAILLYLADKLNFLIPANPRERAVLLKWFFWHAVSQSPMNGQCAHFRMFSPDTTYARERYSREVIRLAKVLDNRLAESAYVAGPGYTIADIVCYPWFDKPRMALGLEPLEQFPHIARWFEKVSARPAIARAYRRFDEDENIETDLKEFAKNMFGHDAHQAETAARSAQETIARMGMRLRQEKP